MEDLVKKIDEVYVAFAKDAKSQTVKRNKAAGTRARKAAIELRMLLKEFRTASLAAAKE